MWTALWLVPPTTGERMLPPLAELPPVIQERVVCSITAAINYQIPANIVLAVAEKEAGKPGQWVRNPNGSYDVGPMQFNTAYLGDLAQYGITAGDVAAPGCYPFELAAWRLRIHIHHDRGDLWTRAANYHSRTPKYNTRYRADLIIKAAKWATWLEASFVTVTQENAKDSLPDQAPAKIPATASAAQIQKRPRSWLATHRAPRSIDHVPRTITFGDPGTQH